MSIGRFTLAWRVCSFCRRTTGLRLWPWNGRLVVETHGICTRCSQRMMAVVPPPAEGLGSL